MPTLREYLLIYQDRMRVDVYRRNALERSERWQAPGDVLNLASVDFSITLNDLYE